MDIVVGERLAYAATFLVDPMLSKKGTYPGFEKTFRIELRNPLAGLPVSGSRDTTADIAVAPATPSLSVRDLSQDAPTLAHSGRGSV